MTTMIKLQTVLLCFIMLLSVAGCAPSINIDNMVATDFPNGMKYPTTVAVTAERGSEYADLYGKTISTEVFRTAVVKSLGKCGMFNSISEKNASNYIINTDIYYIGTHPLPLVTGLAKVRWTLTDRVKGVTAWNSLVETESRCTPLDSIFGEKCEVIALERTVKENIEQALKQLSKTRTLNKNRNK